jgi:hypothetical protein
VAEDTDTADETDDRQETPEERPPGLVRTLAASLWFPAFFVVGFMIFYLIPFHSPSPHHLPIAVVGQSAAQQVEGALAQAKPGGFDVTVLPDDAAVRDAIAHREIVGGYDPADHTLFLAQAEGLQQSQILQQYLGRLAPQPLTVTDVAPPAPNDTYGTSLFYIAMAWNIGGYIVVMMLMQAVTVSRRTKLLTVVGFGAVATVVAWAFGRALDVLPGNASVLVIGFLLTQAVAWTTFGLAPFVRRALPGVAMLLFVLLSIPSSGGAIPRYMVPGFFQFLHPILPLGNAIDAARGILYFGGRSITVPILVLLSWWVVGAALVGLHAWRERRAERDADSLDHIAEYEADAAAVGGSWEHPAPALAGRVLDVDDRPVRDARITVMDTAGRQLALAASGSDGRYRVDALPHGLVTVLAGGSRHEPALHRVLVRDTPSERDFRLRMHGPTTDSVAAVASGVVAGD